MNIDLDTQKCEMITGFLNAQYQRRGIEIQNTKAVKPEEETNIRTQKLNHRIPEWMIDTRTQSMTTRIITLESNFPMRTKKELEVPTIRLTSLTPPRSHEGTWHPK